MKKYTLKEIDRIVRSVVRKDTIIDEDHDFIKPVKESLAKRYGEIIKEHADKDVAEYITMMCEQYDVNYSINVYEDLKEAGMAK